MNTNLARFWRSPLGVAVIAGAAVSTVAVGLSGLVFFPVAVVLGVALVGAASFVLIQTPLGGMAVVAERGRERDERDARVLGGVAAARKRLSMVRLADPAAAAALNRAVLAAGSYLEATVRGAERDPEAEDAVLGAVEAVGDYLREIDAASTRQRAGADKSGRAFPIDAALTERTVRALDAAAAGISARLAAAGPSAADRIAAREELR